MFDLSYNVTLSKTDGLFMADKSDRLAVLRLKERSFLHDIFHICFRSHFEIIRIPFGHILS